MESDSWREWGTYVLKEMKRLNTQIESLDNKVTSIKDQQISQLKIEIAMLKVKSGVWGLIGGLIPIVIVVALELAK